MSTSGERIESLQETLRILKKAQRQLQLGIASIEAEIFAETCHGNVSMTATEILKRQGYVETGRGTF